jgi:hypothetical protein
VSQCEQELRHEAVRRRLNGERRKDICSDLEWSTRWSNKWWLEFRNDPHTDFFDHSRAPLTVSSIVIPEVEQLGPDEQSSVPTWIISFLFFVRRLSSDG